MPDVRIDQFHPCVAQHDAITNELLSLARLFRSLGFASRIFTLQSASIEGERIHPWTSYQDEPRHHLVVHYSLGSPAFEQVFGVKSAKTLLYHNITPSHFFDGINPGIAAEAKLGRKSLPRYAAAAAGGIAHSEFSAAELRRAGCNSVRVIPYYLEDGGDFKTSASPAGGRPEIIVVGRIAPHKRIEQCMFVLDALRRISGADWNLRVIGSWQGLDPYRRALEESRKWLGVEAITLTGRISQQELVRAYANASAFLCMSEHEGFCVPILEAMRFGVPVFAHASGAIPEVMADAGVLFEQRDCSLIAKMIDIAVGDEAIREKLIADQWHRAELFSASRVRDLWLQWLENTVSRR